MNAKITLSFNEAVIKQAKEYAEANNISLSRLIEFLLSKITSTNFKSFEEFPITDWVQQVAEGEAAFQTKYRNRKSVKKDFYKSAR